MFFDVYKLWLGLMLVKYECYWFFNVERGGIYIECKMFLWVIVVNINVCLLFFFVKMYIKCIGILVCLSCFYCCRYDIISILYKELEFVVCRDIFFIEKKVVIIDKVFWYEGVRDWDFWESCELVVYIYCLLGIMWINGGGGMVWIVFLGLVVCGGIFYLCVFVSVFVYYELWICYLEVRVYCLLDRFMCIFLLMM